MSRARHNLRAYRRTLALAALFALSSAAALVGPLLGANVNAEPFSIIAVCGLYAAMFSLVGSVLTFNADRKRFKPYADRWREAYLYSEGDRVFVAIRGGDLRKPQNVGPFDGFSPDDPDAITSAHANALAQAKGYNDRVIAAARLARTLA